MNFPRWLCAACRVCLWQKKKKPTERNWSPNITHTVSTFHFLISSLISRWRYSRRNMKYGCSTKSTDSLRLFESPLVQLLWLPKQQKTSFCYFILLMLRIVICQQLYHWKFQFNNQWGNYQFYRLKIYSRWSQVDLNLSRLWRLANITQLQIDRELMRAVSYHIS